MTLTDVLDAETIWTTVPVEVDRLLKAASLLSRPEADLVWLNPDTGHVLSGDGPPPGFGVDPWVPVKSASGAFRPLFDALQYTPNKFNAVFGGPTPLAGMLAGGALGAGLGYGGGYLTEKLLGPKVLEPGRLRKALAAAGGVLGASPAAYLGTVGARLNAEDGKNPMTAFVEPNVMFGKAGWDKRAEELAGAGGWFLDDIPVDAFNRVVWSDPNTPLGIRAATAGLLEGASQLRGGAQFVSPFDVGRIAAGMGSGLVSGMLVGKALGGLAGLTPDAQNVLKATGMFAGALTNIVPKAFGF